MENTTLVKQKELCTYLNVSESTVKRLKKRGEIPFTKIGRVYRFNLEEVSKALHSNSKTKRR